MPEHLYDPRIQHPYTIWHDDPNLEAFVRDLIEKLRPARWVETGTHMGWTSMWLAKNFPWLPIYTVEVDEDYYTKSKDNLDPYPQVSLWHGSSPRFLRKLLPLLQEGLSVFWLDAHWWPPVPLKEECEIVASLSKYICLIDDFECKNPDFDGDVFDGVPNNLAYVGREIDQRSCFRPNYQAKSGYKGYGLFMKAVAYTPPAFMKEDKP